MRNLLKNLRTLLRRSNKGHYLKRRSKVILGRAFQKLDKSTVLGDNVPASVLAHFSREWSVK